MLSFGDIGCASATVLGLLAGAPDALNDAVAAFAASRFEVACPAFVRIAGQPIPRPSRRATLQQHLGLCAVIEDRPEEAVQHFVAALRAEPKLRFSSALASPQVMEAFRRAHEVILAQDATAPVITHDKPPSGHADQRLDLEATVRDDQRVVYVRLDYRSLGESGFRSAFMEDQGGGRYAGSIPSFAVRAPSIEYYLVATDGANNTARFPDEGALRIAVEGPPPETTAWYGRWWVWAIVGAVAVAGAATTTILLVDDPPASVQVDNPFL